VFAIFTEEMQRVMTMTGAARIADVTKSMLFRDEPGGAHAL
jgi:isopentenyl diphosphate isomerase/L-lactate dehydrogenase-like FMN-dependent dehydrogenase